MKKCQECGEILDSAAVFCTKCGGIELEEISTIVCPNCKNMAAANFGFCTSCGHQLPTHDSSGGAYSVTVGGKDMDGMTCIKCGNAVSMASVFCGNCGNEVNGSATKRKVKKIICQNCKLPNDIVQKQCSYCFSDLSVDDIAELELFMQSKNVEGVEILQCMLSDGNRNLVMCPSCQSMNGLEEEYCHKCGKSLVTQIPKKYCFVCGGENGINATFCNSCGYNFDGGSGEQEWQCPCGCLNERESGFCISCGRGKEFAIRQ